MDVNSILFILALLILVILYVSKPFAARRSLSVTSTEREVSYLMAERERILEALTELDFDNSMGKVPEENYPTQRARLVQQGAEVLRQLDSYRQVEAGSQTGKRERETNGDELEAMISKRRKTRTKKPGAFCHNCSNPIDPKDHFCTNCGVDLT
jgi:hypothetical protein